MGTPQIPLVDSESHQLPLAERQRIAANIADPETPEGAAVGASTGLLAERSLLSHSTAFLGDSITIGAVSTEGTGIQNQGRAWPTHMMLASQGRIRIARNAGVGGNTTAGMLARFDTDVTPYAPSVVVIVGGTNDVGQGVAIATWQANIKALVAKVRGIGAVPVLGTIYPNGESVPAGRAATGEAWNNWLREYCRVNRIRLIPFDRLADPATGGWPAAWVSGDLTHPVAGGATGIIGAFAWAALADEYGAPVVARAAFNGADLLPNGFMTTLGSASSAPSPSAAATAGTGALAAGAYSYKVSTVSVYGESTPSAAASATLSAAGQIVLTWTNVANRCYRVYRKGPADSNWFLINETANSATSFTDDGSFVSSTGTPEITNRAVAPTGFATGTNAVPAKDAGVFTDPAVRGNAYRFQPNSAGGSNIMYVTPSQPVTAGSTVEFTALVRSSSALSHGIEIALTGSGINYKAKPLDSVVAAQPDWQLVSMRFVVPTGVTAAQVYTVTSGPMDVAEFGFRVVPVVS
ncbi:SGNH/GDSL hydrolase family protein [Curtobacterium sp. MCBA15_004]|uniref:SGNH/GDSL hydrolase family protein n=1 Tax=Curtobacterium sp. MCBA15_004 TaxID=1898733 RepID=UPI0009F30D8E|nr:SGNH/GDSL hydrolase family protein [Curtobacterium sp. MCBA15_004]WIA96398.1 SGNH/GDSL hydrolase family protein [Curtobacterium sp. MCBA15_004]